MSGIRHSPKSQAWILLGERKERDFKIRLPKQVFRRIFCIYLCVGCELVAHDEKKIVSEAER